MKRRWMWNAAAGLAVSALAVIGATAATAETPVGKTIESRVLLGFKVSDAAMQEVLPEGWVPFTVPKGPVSGSNLIVALIDRHLILDAEGQPEEPAFGPTVAFMAYARNPDEEGVRGFVVRVYEEAPLVDPYGTSVAADISRDSSWLDAGGGGRTQNETWNVWLDDGAETVAKIGMTGVKLGWSSGESRPYSPVTPEFFRIYSYDQLAGLAMNLGMGLELDGPASFTTSDPGLSAMFDGSEVMTAVVTIPTYVREISLP